MHVVSHEADKMRPIMRILDIANRTETCATYYIKLMMLTCYLPMGQEHVLHTPLKLVTTFEVVMLFL